MVPHALQTHIQSCISHVHFKTRTLQNPPKYNPTTCISYIQMLYPVLVVKNMIYNIKNIHIDVV